MNIKKIMFMAAICMNIYCNASGIVTTFTNSTQLDIKLEIHFSNNDIIEKIVSMAQSYQIVNFEDKKIDYIIFSSHNKDKNGNMYQELQKNFSPSDKNTVYIIGLKNVAAYTVPAAIGTEAFEMPTTQAITCTLEEKDKK